MALLKHPYELSVWDILPEEKKIAIIGSDTMTSPIRAIDPILVRNVNGTVTLTFKMYTRYFDEDKEQITENPFLSMLMVERALKLKYKDKWYDLVIKNRQESSDQKMYSYTAKSAHICELSKTGFDLEFKTELQNNQGTITELGEKIMEGTDWKIGSGDIVRAYQDDQLILCQTSSEFSGVKMLDKTSANVSAGKQFYAFYTDWKAFQEEEKELQILLVEYSTIADGKNLDDLILDGEYYDDNGILTIGDNVLVQYSIDTKNKITKVQTSNYRGRRLVKKQKTRFNATLDRYVNIYTSEEKNSDGSLKEVEGYSKTEFLSPNFVENLIVNSKDFESTAGWYGKIEGEDQPTVELDYYPPISQETDWEKVAVTSRLKITPKATNIGNKVYNTGLRSNFSKIEDFAAGEQLLLCYNFVNENNKVLGKDDLADANVTFSIEGFSSSSCSFDQDSEEIGGIERENFPKQIFTATKEVTKEELKKAQFTITFNGSGPYYLKDISLFRYVKGDITENEGTETEQKYTDIIIYPGDVPDNKPIVTNFYYDVKENANNKAEEYIYLNSNGTYTPIYNDANYEKIASIEKSESNRFNLIQELCETFECWADFVIEHNSNGKVLSKTIYFKEYIGENRYTGFKYGINLKSIQRTIDSEQIATKIIVKPNSNEHGENGFCTIARATENPLGGTYLLNFDYYVNQGLLKKEDLDSDLYTKFIIYERDEEGNIKLDEEENPIVKYDEGFYDLMYEKSRRRDEIIAERTAFSASYLEGIAAKEVADETLQATEQLLSDLKQQYKQYSGVEWPNISPKHREGEKADGKIADNEIYKFITKIQQAQSMRDDAEEDAAKYEDYTEDNYEAKLKEYNAQVQGLKIEELEDDFFNKYHNFIQEGTWNSEEYWDDNEYYIDALDVARTSSRPKVTYTINVIDVSVLDDYEGYEFDVGDKTFMEDPEFFGYVFYKSGEESYKKPYKEEVVITEISEHLEAPEGNQIKVQNYKTQFDDLFQRITAQTQSLQYASGGYNRASAAINSDGTIDGELLQNSLLNYALALMNPENKGVIWDRDGIRIIDRENTNKILKLTGGALQISNDGGNTWAIAVNGNGINAGLVTTGSINTEEIMIGNSQNFSFRWDVNGLNAYTKNEGKNQDGSYNYGKFVRFDQYGLYGYSKGTIFNPSEGTTTLEEGLNKVKENADFGLTWDGFFLKSKHNDSSDLGFIEIDSENDFQVIGNDGKTPRVKIGLIETVYETSTDNEGNEIQTVKDRIYGLRLFDVKGKKVIDTLSDGSIDITGTITATGGDIGGWVINTGNLSSVQGEEGIILDAANSQIYSQKYFTSNSGNGWMINNDEAIFNNITLRGALKCAVLEYAEVQAVGGIMMIRPASTIKNYFYNEINQILTVEVENSTNFKIGDFCKFATEIEAFDEENPKIVNGGVVIKGGINTHLYQLENIENNILQFSITLANWEDLKDRNLDGMGIVSLGATEDIGLGLNSSNNRAMIPGESFSVFSFEEDNDTGWKYLKPHIILGKIPNDSIFGAVKGQYGLYADAADIKGTIRAEHLIVGSGENQQDYIDKETGLINSSAISGLEDITSFQRLEIKGEQVFKQTGETYSPEVIILTIEKSENLEIQGWYYKTISIDGIENWVFIEGSAQQESFTVNANDIYFQDNGIATFKVIDSTEKIYDIFSIYRIRDGLDGVGSYNIFLTNENIRLVEDSEGALFVDQSFECGVECYLGTEKKDVIISSVIPDYEAFYSEIISQNLFKVYVTIEDAYPNQSDPMSGQIKVNISSPIQTTLYLNWNRVSRGVAGPQGKQGEDGKGIAYTEIQYFTSDTSDTPSSISNKWTIIAPSSYEKGKYYFYRQVYYYEGGGSDYSEPAPWTNPYQITYELGRGSLLQFDENGQVVTNLPVGLTYQYCDINGENESLEPTDGLNYVKIIFNNNANKYWLASKQGLVVGANAIFSGTIVASNGLIGGWTIGDGYLWDNSGNVFLDANSTDVQNSTGGVIRVGLNNGNYNFRVLNTGTTLIGYAGQDSDGKPIYNVKIDSNGDVSITGNITATSGVIGGWVIEKMAYEAEGEIQLLHSSKPLGKNHPHIMLFSSPSKGTLTNDFVQDESPSGGGYYVTSTSRRNHWLMLGGYLSGQKYTFGIREGYTDEDGNTNNPCVEALNVRVQGEITATSGYIGTEASGWKIQDNSIYNGTNSMASKIVGTYIGTDGFRNYKNVDTYVDIKDGVINANGANITGEITATGGTIGGFTIEEDCLSSEYLTLDPTGQHIGNIFDIDINVYISLLNKAKDNMLFSLSEMTTEKGEYVELFVGGSGHFSGELMADTLSVSGLWLEHTSDDSEQKILFGGDSLQISSNIYENVNFVNDTVGITMSENNCLIVAGQSGIFVYKYSDGSQGNLLGTWYLNGSSIATTSDKQMKNSIEIYSLEYSILFDNLKPIRYKYNDGTSNRYHTGFIAQEVEEAILKSELTTQEFAGFVRSIETETDPTTGEEIQVERCYLRYEEFIALNTNEIQKLKKRVTELETQLAELLNQ